MQQKKSTAHTYLYLQKPYKQEKSGMKHLNCQKEKKTPTNLEFCIQQNSLQI